MVSDNRSQEIRSFLNVNKKNLPQEELLDIKRQLENLSDEQFERVNWVSFQDPLVLLIISLFFGTLGIDRFMLDDVKNGILKLLLCCLIIGWIWWLVDLITISRRTKEYNYRKLMDFISVE